VERSELEKDTPAKQIVGQGFPRTKDAEDKKDAKKNKTDNFNHRNTRICTEVKDQGPAEQHVG
jgi:hypothetical protein